MNCVWHTDSLCFFAPAEQYHASGVRRPLSVGVVSFLWIASGTRIGRVSLLQRSNMSIETGGLEVLALQRSAMSKDCPNFSII